jgi:hypothetical protein
MTGIVMDTLGIMLSGVEVTLPRLQKRVVSGDDGTFRLAGVGPGTYSIRARKIGFAPQVKEIRIGKDGGVAVFELVSLGRFLPATVVTATAGGLTGVVADTAYQPIPSALVSLLGTDLRAVTDASGRFFLPARPGSHMIHVSKTEFRDRVVSVTIPPDSGRHVALQLGPFIGPTPVRQAWNIPDFASRLAWRNRLTEPFYTREDLQRLGFEWVIDAVRVGGMAQYDADCRAVKDGGPETIEIGQLTIDDVEALEIRASARSGGPTVPGRSAAAASSRRVKALVQSTGMSNAARALFENQGGFCPLVYVWLR